MLIIHNKFIPDGHTVNKKNVHQNPPLHQVCSEKETSRNIGTKQLVSFA
jgi:hypothetical protein